MRAPVHWQWSHKQSIGFLSVHFQYRRTYLTRPKSCQTLMILSKSSLQTPKERKQLINFTVTIITWRRGRYLYLWDCLSTLYSTIKAQKCRVYNHLAVSPPAAKISLQSISLFENWNGEQTKHNHRPRSGLRLTCGMVTVLAGSRPLNTSWLSQPRN